MSKCITCTILRFAKVFFYTVKSSYKVQKPGKRPDLPYNKKLSIWRWAKKCSQLSGQSFSPPPPMLVWMDHFPKGGLTLNKLFFKTLPSWCNTSSLSYKSYKRCFPNVVLPGVHGYPPPMCWAAAFSRSDRQTKPILLLLPKGLTLQIPKYPKSMDFVNADFDQKSDQRQKACCW